MHPSRHRVHFRRAASDKPLPSPFEEPPDVILKARADTTTDSTSACKDGDTSSRCEKPAGASNPTLPIVLGSLVPIFIALLVLVWLHQRHQRKLKREDAMDKTKSMDFGFGVAPAGKYPAGGEKSTGQSRRQLSMDIDVGSPYLLCTGIRGSKESLHSLPRTGDDRYGRPMTANSGHSPHSPLSNVTSPWADPSRPRNFDSSYVQSTSHENSPTGSQMSMTAELLRGAQQMPNSTPPRSASLPKDGPFPAPRINIPSPAVTRPPPPRLAPNVRGGLSVNTGHGERDSYVENDGGDLRRSHMHLAKHIEVQQPPPVKASVGLLPPSQVGQASSTPGPPQVDITLSPSPNFKEPVGTAVGTLNRPVSDDQSDYGDGIQFRLSVASIESGVPQPATQVEPRKSLTPGSFDGRRLSMGYRPLPPDGNPEDTAEERAMRIRSFYKEYFDDSNPPPPVPMQPSGPVYEEDYGYDYYDDSAAVFNPENGRFQIPGARPFAEPIARRAMTPPPRFGPHPRSGSATGGRFMPPGSRSYSSASGPMGPGRRPPPQRRPIPPPQPLHNLPTPHLLKEDAFASPIMFAPPSRSPGSEAPSLRGGIRPYSPSVSPHVPLASAFDELSVLPTPHMLRKSGTYTALDFAPPRKFKNDDGMSSDSGSVRSNKSGISALQVHNIRNGAYRVSRIPQEVVPVRDQMASNLKPTWDMRP